MALRHFASMAGPALVAAQQRLAGDCSIAATMVARGALHSAPLLKQQQQRGHANTTSSSSAGDGSGGGDGATTVAATVSSSSSSSKPSLHVYVEPLGEGYEGISTITLARPAAKNAIGRQLLRELSECINTLRQERTTRCVILRSSVPAIFCAGADLKERATMTMHETHEFVNSLRRTFTELEALPMPTIAAIEGAALGGGLEMVRP